MTPKEKAKELYLKYTNALDIRDLRTTANPFAKECALISVNEILKGIVPKDDDERYAFELGGNQFYWQGVKQEIEKL